MVLVVVVVDRTCVVGHRNLPYKANLKIAVFNISGKSEA